MESFFARHKNATILAVVLMAQILGLATQIRRPTENGPVRLIRQWAVALVSPFERVLVYSEQWTHHAWRDYFYLRGVSRENAELREQIERMRLEQIRMEQDAAQARRIQALLQFKEQYISKTVAAQVIGSSGSETSRIIYIDRGSNEGIESNMAVITPEGIVGKVLRVYPTTSQVLEITDQTSGVGAMLVKSRLQGILKGLPAGNPNLAYIMADETVAPGEDVITSGGDRIFPERPAHRQSRFGQPRQRPFPQCAGSALGEPQPSGRSAGHHQNCREGNRHQRPWSNSRRRHSCRAIAFRAR